jgi:AAA domain/Nuclease-related domain
MALVHTPLPADRPGHHGEYAVGQVLSKFSNPDLELWFDVNYIAGVTDLDLFLVDSQAGFYLIEIKSMKLEAIEEFTQSTFLLQGGQVKQHPVSQLRTGSLKLRDYLKRMPAFKDKQNLPFIQATVLWSEITRKEWTQRFTDASISGFHEMCLFKDDIKDYNSLVLGLQRLWDKPILGVEPPYRVRGMHSNIEAFRKALDPGKHKIDVPQSFSAELSRAVSSSQSIAEKYPPGKSYKASLQGAPGTGKTTILRQIGLANLAAGARVLHVCFNKVLAADQKREYQILRKTVDEYGFIDVFDIWELYKELGHSGGILKEDSVLQSAEAFMNTEEGKHFVKYDVILIDESQDLRDDFFKVVELIARPTASWFIAYGKGQETNNFKKDSTHPSPWLIDFLATAEANHLRRSFRNSTRAFLLAQSFWEKFPSLADAKGWMAEKFSKNAKPDNQYELDLDFPRIENDFTVEVLPGKALRKAYIRKIVLAALEDTKRADRGQDLLCAVLKPPSDSVEGDPGSISSSYELVLSVLTEIAEEFKLDFLDLVPKENRREVPKLGAIRLISLQNIRGLSASHVLLFDLGQLEKWSKVSGGTIKPPLINFTYIALSRSKASTIVAIDSTEDSDIESFLVEMVSYSTELAIASADPRSTTK